MGGGDGGLEGGADLVEVDLVGTLDDELLCLFAVRDFQVVGHFE